MTKVFTKLLQKMEHIKLLFSPRVSCLAYVLFLGCLHCTAYGSMFKHRKQMGEEIIPSRWYMFVYSVTLAVTGEADYVALLKGHHDTKAAFPN